MSYILDALRKSDQQRQRERGVAPMLLTAQASAAVSRRPAFWPYGVLAALLLGAGMAIGWLRPWQPLDPAPAAAVVAHPLESSARLPAPEAAVRPQPERQLAAPAPVSAKPAAPVRAEARARSTPTETLAAASGQVAKPVPQRPAGSSDAAPAVITAAELPAPVQQELPALTISVHAYSGKPADRLVGINNRLLHEGEYVADGLKLEQITPDGMILGYKGYRFRRGVK
jgi:general secretion pathway protein B